ncbi:prepilin-type N-terminal cleavage/methylation domain-containing protein [Obesumbacterium proteus]|uniref:prepilin-type N-terminal cleavage/methylation domain-containing protein n=1 Tax=Obesumbacterium proteus TaxID=82983 RepID=UPI0010352EB7|nr:prepilin-type N-terminal cleavage/methylation domain-containing protein [Obesumbacterium proteus]TBL76830.1 prepilin-type N-terminal cleavage/methylation domain-containing protein [Obesumbacterium proteus]
MLTVLRQKVHRQSGFGLIEVMVSILLVSVGFLGMLHYQQWMTQAQIRVWQQQRAWQFSEQAITLYRMGVPAAEISTRLSLPKLWQLEVSIEQQANCEMINAKISAPLNIQAKLERTICEQLAE